MPNKSHFNPGHIAINQLKKNGIRHSAGIDVTHSDIECTLHALFIEDAVKILKRIPDSSIQLILVDPPYNLDLDYWDTVDQPTLLYAIHQRRNK